MSAINSERFAEIMRIQCPHCRQEAMHAATAEPEPARFNSDDRAGWPIAIDPPGCGCTECIIGQYKPLDEATQEQIVDMLTGRIGNNLGSWENENTSVEVTVRIYDRAWKLTPEQAARLTGIDISRER